MTVDVEDYYQVHAFANQISRQDWQGFEPRVERNTNIVLELFADAGVRATFFTLGWIAERHPELIRRIAEAGHEIASHGYEHERADKQSREKFRADVRRTKSILEDIGGQSVMGYRAASFSIGTKNLWAFDVLAEEGYAYSSSVYPIAHDHYGMPEAPRFAFRPVSGSPFIEAPMTTNPLLGRNVPCAGGGYFRLLPYAISRWQIARVNRMEQQACIFYFHPWEIDPSQPRPRGVSFKARLRHYVNLRHTRGRLERLLRDFAWNRLDSVLGIGQTSPAPAHYTGSAPT
jgi:polysaccharide deacetylase family protein (PEP-CTERM system associated)